MGVSSWKKDPVHDTLADRGPVANGICNFQCTFGLGNIASKTTHSHVFNKIFAEDAADVIVFSFRVRDLCQCPLFVVVAPPVVSGKDHRSAFIFQFEQQVRQSRFHPNRSVWVLDERADPVWNMRILTCLRFHFPVKLR